MKKIWIAIITVSILAGCSSEGLVVEQHRKPDYLKVFNEYKETDLRLACDEFEEEMRRKPMEKNHQVLPYDLRADMDILEEHTSDGVYTAELSCKVRITYSLSATTYVHEEHDKNLGTLSFKY